jgi:hypothetical protein
MSLVLWPFTLGLFEWERDREKHVTLRESLRTNTGLELAMLVSAPKIIQSHSTPIKIIYLAPVIFHKCSKNFTCISHLVHRLSLWDWYFAFIFKMKKLWGPESFKWQVIQLGVRRIWTERIENLTFVGVDVGTI